MKQQDDRESTKPVQFPDQTDKNRSIEIKVADSQENSMYDSSVSSQSAIIGLHQNELQSLPVNNVETHRRRDESLITSSPNNVSSSSINDFNDFTSNGERRIPQCNFNVHISRVSQNQLQVDQQFRIEQRRRKSEHLYGLEHVHVKRCNKNDSNSLNSPREKSYKTKPITINLKQNKVESDIQYKNEKSNIINGHVKTHEIHTSALGMHNIIRFTRKSDAQSVYTDMPSNSTGERQAKEDDDAEDSVINLSSKDNQHVRRSHLNTRLPLVSFIVNISRFHIDFI